MPGGLANPLLGYAAFSAVKFGGYTFAAWRLNRSYSDNPRNVVGVGATRTGIGMAFGTVLTMLLFPLIFTGGPGLVVGYLVFVPVRLCEWWLIILIFYDRQLETRAKDLGFRLARNGLVIRLGRAGNHRIVCYCWVLDLLNSRRCPNRWTQAARACFASSKMRRRLNEIATPRQLRRSASLNKFAIE